jgi:DNA-binding winged helix-turn-helix (wHTH) protein/TolB-like protein
MSGVSNHIYEFGSFRVDAANRLLLREDEPLTVTPKAVDTLLALVRRRGYVLHKNDLMKEVWPDTVVEESNLTQHIYLLRKTLGEGPDGRSYIETIPRRGYRFIGEVREVEREASDIILAERTKVQVVIEEQKENEINGEAEGEKVEGDCLKRTGTAARMATQSVFNRSHNRDHSVNWRGRLSTRFALGAVTVVALGWILYLALPGRPGASETRPAIRSIAVLPFRPLGPASADEGLGVGMTDALITQLSNARQITVRPTSAVLRYGVANQDLLTAGRELGVDALLDGRFQRDGGRVRVTVQLISVGDGTPLWADTFDEQFTDMLAVQDAIAQRVSRALALKLTPEEQRLLAKRYTENPEAYQAYLYGRSYLSRRATASVEESIKYFELALQHDPDYALAWAGLADAYTSLGYRYDMQEQTQSQVMPKAKAAAARALKLDDQLAEAHAALGVVRERYDWDFAGAEIEYKRAIVLNPDYAPAHHLYSRYLLAMGRFGEAEKEMRLAQELDPLSFSISRGIGDILFRMGKYEEALEQYRRTLKMAPDDPMSAALHRTMGWAYLYRGTPDQAVTEFIEALRLQNVRAEWLAALRQAYDRAGIKSYWRKWIELQQERIKGGRVSPFYLAQIYAFLGEKEQALAYLQAAFEDRSIVLPALQFDLQFDHLLRAEPRYASLLRRVGITR